MRISGGGGSNIMRRKRTGTKHVVRILTAVGGVYIARVQCSSLGEGAAVVSLGAVVMEEGVQVRVQVG